MTDEELIEEHDREARHTVVGVSFYLTELRHRETQKSLANNAAELSKIGELLRAGKTGRN